MRCWMVGHSRWEWQKTENNQEIDLKCEWKDVKIEKKNVMSW